MRMNRYCSLWCKSLILVMVFLCMTGKAVKADDIKTTETVPVHIQVEEIKEFKIRTLSGSSLFLDFGVLRSHKRSDGSRGLLFADSSRRYAVLASVISNAGRQYMIRHEEYVPMRSVQGTEYKAVDSSGRKIAPLTCLVLAASGESKTQYPEGIRVSSRTSVKGNQVLYMSESEGRSDRVEVEYFLGNIVSTQRAGKYVGSITYSMVEL